MTRDLPPLIASGPDLDAEAIARYSRHTRIPGLGSEGQRRLRAARVLLIGAGGLGSPVALYLAAAGIGTLGVVDHDVVELSNLQRQILHRGRDVGQPKAVSAARAIGEFDPAIEVHAIQEHFDDRSALRLLKGWDVVIDGSDNFTTRYMVDDACVLTGIPHVWGSVLQFEGQFSVFWHNPPKGTGIDYRDLYPSPPPAEFAPSCAEAGVLGALCGIVGSFMALETIKLISGAGPVALGTLHIVDGLDGGISSVEIAPRHDRTEITRLEPVREACPAGAGEIDTGQLQKLLDAEGTILLDVRDEAERRAVRIPGSLHIPLEALLDSLAQEKLDPRLCGARQLVVHSAAGTRSRRAVQALARSGLPASSLIGGIEQWCREDYPFETLSKEEPA